MSDLPSNEPGLSLRTAPDSHERASSNWFIEAYLAPARAYEELALAVSGTRLAAHLRSFEERHASIQIIHAVGSGLKTIIDYQG